MGNSQSSDSPQSPASANATTPNRRSREREASQHRNRPSGHGQNVTLGRRTAGPGTPQQQQHQHHPPSNLIPTSPIASTSTSTAHAHATVSASPATSTHSRARSITTSGVPPASDNRSDPTAMGQAESRHRPPSRSATIPGPPLDIERGSRDASADNVGTPTSALDAGEPVDSHGYAVNYSLGPSDFSRPPRLPLPIETEHEPGSPIPSPSDLDAPPLESSDIDGGLGRQASMLSSTTLDDDDVADIGEFVLESNPSQPKVPTRIEYHGDAKGVYVTGTFVKWERKFRLHRNPQTGSFSTTFPLPTGTHHLKFLVDGDMRTSEELPTTVDFTNVLVNYIEVVAPSTAAEAQGYVASGPMPIPGAAVTAGQSGGTADGAARPIPIRSGTGANDGAVATSTRQQAVDAASQKADSTSTDPHAEQPPQKLVKKAVPRPKYTNTIPKFLNDLDLYQTPDDPHYRRATKVSDTLPAPPSLPGFMGKSILNATTPHKDDASVLSMPNHTVLNHLATSSIKHGVLATSGTTRYKRKFLTTIMYKPTSDDG